MAKQEQQNRIYRQSALDRLASPDELDQKLTVLPPMGWVAVLALLVLMGAALAWGFLGSVSNTVNGNGVLAFSEGIVTMLSQSEGRLTDIGVKSGQYVEKGQVMARIVKDDLLRQLEECKEDLDALDAITVETLAFDYQRLNYDIYPEFASLSQQIRVTQAQYYSQLEEYYSQLQNLDNEKQIQNAQVEALRKQIELAERQLAQYQELRDYEREVELEKAADQPNRELVLKGVLYYDERGNYYRRQNRAALQHTVYDQVGTPYVLLCDGEVDLPVYYLNAESEEIYDSGNSYYLPGYSTSRFEDNGTGSSGGTDLQDGDYKTRRQTPTIYYDQAGTRFIDRTGSEFRAVKSEETDKSYDQLLNRPAFDSTEAGMEMQLEQYIMQLRQAELEAYQMDSRMTSYLQGTYKQTAVQLEALTDQFRQTKEIRRNDLLLKQEKLRDQMTREGQLVATASGTLVDLALRKDDYIQVGTEYASVIGDQTAIESDKVYLFVPIDQGKQIKLGMEVNIYPSISKREEHGYILGRVTSVSDYAVSGNRLQELLQNDQMIEHLSAGNPVLEVEVQLQRDDATPSGYSWSTKQGYSGEIPAGTVCAGEVKVSTQRPIDLIVPFIRSLFTGEI